MDRKSLYGEVFRQSRYKPYGQQSFGGGNITNYLTGEELDYLAALPSGSAPSTASFSHLFRTILKTYMPLAPRIREERPEILEKFKRMGQDMEKAQEEKRKAGFPNK